MEFRFHVCRVTWPNFWRPLRTREIVKIETDDLLCFSLLITILYPCDLPYTLIFQVVASIASIHRIMDDFDFTTWYLCQNGDDDIPSLPSSTTLPLMTSGFEDGLGATTYLQSNDNADPFIAIPIAHQADPFNQLAATFSQQEEHNASSDPFLPTFHLPHDFQQSCHYFDPYHQVPCFGADDVADQTALSIYAGHFTATPLQDASTTPLPSYAETDAMIVFAMPDDLGQTASDDITAAIFDDYESGQAALTFPSSTSSSTRKSKRRTSQRAKSTNAQRCIKDPADRPHHCGDCGRSFERIHDFRRHLLTHMEADDEYRWPCTYCDKTFTRYYALSRHHGRKHGAQPYHKPAKPKPPPDACQSMLMLYQRG